MADDAPKTPNPFSIENLLYAPIGAAAMLRDMLPTVVNMLSMRGRQQVSQLQEQVNSSLNLARSLGQLRVGQAGEEVRKRAKDLRGGAEGSLRLVQGRTRSASGTAGSMMGRTRTEAGTADAPLEPVDEGAAAAAVEAAAAEAATLAIREYESLSASQVVERLPGLSPEELADVRDYEERHRGRKTVLHRLDALLGA